MASLNLSSNGQSIKSSYQGVINGPAPSSSSPTYAQWALFSVQAPLANAFQDSGSKESILKVQSTGDGELAELIEDFSEGRIQFAFVKVKDPNSGLPKYALIAWCGGGVPERTKGYFTTHTAAVSKILHGYHVQITARSDSDLEPESIVKKIADASGAKYSAGASSTASPAPPPVASKPVFNPTASSASNPLVAARNRRGGNVDEDGWGEDAPQVSRSQLEKVDSAYKPTKVNMAELTNQRQEPSRFNSSSKQEDDGDVVRGGYQPIGKVDIAAIRAAAKNKVDDRPTTQELSEANIPAAQPPAGAQAGGQRALIQYDYEKAEDNEVELREGQYVTNIEMVDEDWWMGTNSKGESGLFPSNYVELVEDEPEQASAAAPAPAARSLPPPAPAQAEPEPQPQAAGRTATALFDYEAAEDNELGFRENDKITDIEFPDEDWWFGHLRGKQGLFPANYVELDQ
ncbi:hypothetical protein BN1708_014202 [Verticillium longisporum]|uniref:SH3 domain-containing protein n=1 Tax=Verticillium longisporum TaxID=100787 RepID=A0A0G4LT83_VERLO|nr:hypothetical protein BN1708_014202 [Verticillium longisporum]